MKTVLLGLSGGVDSAVAAFLLKKKGYNVIGAFMKNFSETKNQFGECAWIEERKMAQKVAAVLDIPFVTLDFEKQYNKQVLEPMFKQYAAGKTPNPDIVCNTVIKFPLLWKEARKLKVDLMATGHHARIKKSSLGFKLLQGRDKSKDQSYFLYELTQHDLEHTLMPIGDYTKSQVRAMAKIHKLPNHDKPSTKGVCFVGNVPLKKLLEQKIGQKKGIVMNDHGIEIGTHNGAQYYTIGERARESTGISISKGEGSQHRFFVASKNSKKNTITVVPQGHAMLKKTSFQLKNIHWVNSKSITKKLKAEARFRHLGKLVPCVFDIGKKVLITSQPIIGAAPGQYAVIYKGQELICGGELV